MEKPNALTKGLALAGAILVWLPLAAPLALSAIGVFTRGFFRLDYLMPAELLPLVVAGGLLLVWASARARARRRWIGWSLAAALLSLVTSQAVAVATGLATGTTPPTGWEWALVLALLVGYILAVVALGLGGIWLVRGLYARPAPK